MNNNELMSPVNILHKVMMINDPESFLGVNQEKDKKRKKVILTCQTSLTQGAQRQLSKEISSLISHPEFIGYQLAKKDVLCMAIS